MTSRIRALLLWSPRVLGLAVVLFLAAFALDVFGERRGPLGTALALLIHLAPALLVLAAVLAAWRRAWVGALVFLALAAGYAAMVPGRPDWILAISGPLALVGVLFALSWRAGRGTPGTQALVVLVAAAVAAGGLAAQQPPPGDSTRVARRAGADSLRPTARDRVGADDPRCDDLCRRERMLDSLYGRDRERLPARPAPARPQPKKP